LRSTLRGLEPSETCAKLPYSPYRDNMSTRTLNEDAPRLFGA
jgi:hypothetical protein